MKRLLVGLAISSLSLVAEGSSPKVSGVADGRYLFVWAGDLAKQGHDFLTVIDANPSSTTYGRMVSAVETYQVTVRPHHTEYTMPASGLLFANDHDAGSSFVFDVRDPLRPRLTTTFNDMASFAHPHSYVRLPNGHVLATFQHDHQTMQPGKMGKSGGLVEIDDQGKVVRSASNADPAFPDALLMPYSLAVLPNIDRVVSTNSSMHLPDIFSGTTFQVWRLSDLKLLKTAYMDVGGNRSSHIGPQEPRVGPDGAVYAQTLSCGVERITSIETATPTATLVHTFPGNWCGVPTIVGRWFVQPVPDVQGFIVLDLADGAHPKEVSQLRVSDKFYPHWTAWDPVTGRVVAPPNSPDDNRMYLLKLDQKTGALTVDETFRDTDGKVGFSFADRVWPHGWKGTGLPHGAVFSRPTRP